MGHLFRFFIGHSKFSLMLTALLCVAGILALLVIRRETLPPVDFATVTIRTLYPGASSEEVEIKVTDPIEDELRTVDGLKDVRSISQPGLSQIIVRIDIDRRDTEKIVADVQQAVDRVTQLPPEVRNPPAVTELKADMIPIVELAVVGPNTGRERDALADQLRLELEDVPGVADVTLTGYREREYQVRLDQKKMAAFQVGIDEVTQAVAAQNQNIPAGYIRTPDRRYLVRILGQARGAAELENIPVRAADTGSVILVKDVGTAVEVPERPEVLARVDGAEATRTTVTKKSSADAIRTLKRAKDVIDKFKSRMTPAHSVRIVDDEGARIKRRLSIVINNAVGGFFLVLAVAFFFLPGWLGVFSSLSLVFGILGTLAAMVLFGANFNIITMLGILLALGMLVDNSVVIAENYLRLREEGIPPQEAALRAARTFWVPLTVSTLTTIFAFLPMLVTRGVLGEFIKWIPIVMTSALLISLFESTFLLPARLQYVMRRNNHPAQGHRVNALIWKGYSRLEKAFGRWMHWAVSHRYITALILLAVFMSGFLVSVLGNRFELFPNEDVEYYVARYDLPPSAAIEATDAMGAKLSRQIQEVIGKENLLAISSRAGVQQIDAGDVQAISGENVGVIIAIVKQEAARKIDTEEMLAQLRKIPADGLTQLAFEVLQNGPPVGKPLTVTFRSNERAELRAAVDEFERSIQPIPGVFNVLDTEHGGSAPEYLFLLNQARLATAGLDLQRAGLSLRAALEGFIAAELFSEGVRFDLRVQLAPEESSQLRDIEKLRLLNNLNHLVPITAIGKFERAPGPPDIRRYDFKRSITVTADVVPHMITSTALNRKAQDIVPGILAKHPTVSVDYGGEEESTQDSIQSLAMALIIAVIAIFALLVLTFESFSKPFLILTSIPFGLVGVFWAFFLHRKPLSFLAFIGVVALTGTVVNAAIILTSYIEELRKDPSLSLEEVVVTASRRRLRAVLISGITTVIGLVPSVYGIGGYDPVLVPMTMALAWGLIVGSLLSVVWIPCGYAILDDVRRKVFRIRS